MVLSDVYRGIEGVPRGTVKYLRVMETVPRPWAARRYWDGDAAYQQHAVVSLNGSLHVTGYREKPTLPYDVSMGVYMFNKSILDLIDRGRYFDFPSLVRLLIQRGENTKVYLSDDEWLDIGRQDDYAKALETFAGSKERFLPPTCQGVPESEAIALEPV